MRRRGSGRAGRTVGFAGFLPAGTVKDLFKKNGLTVEGIAAATRCGARGAEMAGEMRDLAIDHGTTNTKARAVDETGRIPASAAAPSTSDDPKPGRAGGIWAATRKVIDSIAALTISNSRETVFAWDSESGAPVGPAIL